MSQKTNSNFSNVYDDFEAVIDELKVDPALNRFREEYEHLLGALKSSAERVDYHMSNYNQLKEGLLMDSYGIETALKQTENDEVLKKNFVNQIENVKKALDSLKERDEKNNERIATLKANIAKVNKTIKNWQDLNNSNDEFNDKLNEIESLRLDKDLLIQKKKHIEDQLSVLKTKIEGKTVNVYSLNESLKKKNKKIKSNQQKLEEQENVRNKEITLIESLKRDKNELITTRNDLVEKKKDLKKTIDKQYQFKLETDKYINKIEKQVEFQLKHEKEFTKRYNENIKLSKTLQERVEDKQNEIAITTSNLIKLEKNIGKNEEVISKKLITIDEQKELLGIENMKLENLKRNVFNLESRYKELEAGRMDEQKKITNLDRECGLLRDLLNKCENNKNEQFEEIFKRGKEIEINKVFYAQLEKKIVELKQNIEDVDLSKKKHQATINANINKMNYYEDELKIKEKLVNELSKKHMELELKLKDQHNLCESVKTDRFLYSKQLREKKGEFEDLKNRHKNINIQIIHIKEELDRKDQEFRNKSERIKELEQNIEFNQSNSDKLTAQLEGQEAIVKELKQRIEKFKEKLGELQKENQKTKEKFDIVVSERDLLSIQILKREEEINLFSEKLKIKQSMIEKIQHQYNDKTQKICLLRNTSRNILYEIKELKEQAARIPDLFIDYKLLDKEYFNECLKTKILEKELNCPVNVHRWRKLESTDSKTFDLIKKIQTLQKRLLLKNDELVEKKKAVDDKEKEIANLKDVLKKQPSLVEHEFAEKLKDTIRDKNKQLVDLEVELNKVKNEHFESEFEFKKLNEEIRELKLQYGEAAREIKMKENSQNLTNQEIRVRKAEKVFTGGGFRIR